MTAAMWSALITTGGLIVIGLITNHQNKRGEKATNALAARVVDREDFDAVMTRMENDLARSDKRASEQDKRITQLEARLEAEVDAREKAEARAIRAEKRADAAEQQTTRLERRVSQLEQVLRDHDIPVPPIA